MTALGLTSVIYLACLILSGLIYWSCRVGNLAGFANARRTVLAMYRAADAGLIKGARSSLVSLVVMALLWAAARVMPHGNAETPRPVITAGYVMLTAVAGGLMILSLAYVVLNWARASSLRAISAALVSTDRLLVTVTRSTAGLALLVEGLGFVSSAVIASLCWATSSGTPASTGPQTHPLLNTALVLSDFAIGAILVSFVMQTSGTAYRTCGRMGSATATHDTNLGEQDPRNPSTIADAAGIQLGHLLPATLDAFCSSLCSNVLLLFILWALRTESSAALPASYLLLPLVLRAFGALSTVFAMASMRTMESLNPAAALSRSQVVFIVVVIGAIGGGCTWLAPEQFLRLALCGLVGFLLPLGLGHWQNFAVNRAVQRAKAPRQAHEGLWAEGLSVGMLAAAGPLVALILVVIAVFQLGLSTAQGHGEWLALMVCYLGMGIAMPFCITIDATRPVVALARRAVHLIDSLRVDDGQRRLARLEEASCVASSQAISTQTQAAVGMPLLAALAIGVLAKSSKSPAAGPELLSTLYLCPLTLLVPFAVMLQASLRASRAISNEVRRQIGGFPQDSGVTRVPAEFTPSYRNCVDIASRESNRHRGLPGVAFVGIPLLFGAVLCHATVDSGPTGRALALYLGAIAVTVSVTGFILEAASDFANKALSRTPRATSFQHCIALGDVVSHLAAHATPAIRLLAKATVIVALIYSPHVL